MDELQVWEMPAPPPSYVVSVRDWGGVVYRRGDPDGTMWVGPRGAEHWESLVYNDAPITAHELAQ